MLEAGQKLRQTASIISSTSQSPVYPIKLSTSISLINIKEEIKFLQSVINPNVKYDIRNNGMRKMILLINDGILQNQEFLNALPFFHAGLVSSISNSRNSSTKTACILISRLSLELSEKFESLGNFMRPFSNQYAIRTQIIADCCLESMLTITKNCCTKKILVQLAGLCTSKVPKIRFSASKCMYQFITSAPVEVLEDSWYIMSKSLRALLNDPNMEIKDNAKRAAKKLLLIDPDHYQDVLSYFTSHSQRLIPNEKIDFHDSGNRKNGKQNCNVIRISDYKIIKHKKNNYDEIQTISSHNINDNDIKNSGGNNNQNSKANQNEIEKHENNYFSETQTNDQYKIDSKKEIIYIERSNFVVNGSDSSSSSSSIDRISETKNVIFNMHQKETFSSHSLVNSGNQSILKYPTLGTIRQKKILRSPAPLPSHKSSKIIASDTDLFSPIQKNATRCSSVSGIRLRSIPLISPSIRQANGHGKCFLDNLREMIEKNDTSEISGIISNIIDDVIKCCSLQILAVPAISVLGLLLSRFHSAFESKLTQLIPTLLNQGSKASKRASENAMQLLKELSYYFPPSLLVRATIYSPPSQRLVAYGSFLVDCPTDELFNDFVACQFLLHITLDSYLFDMKSSGHILEIINKMRPDYVKKFFSSMDDKQFYSYQKHFKDLHPNVEFPPLRPVNVPNFPDINVIQSECNSDDDICTFILNWTNSFISFVEKLHSFQFKIAHKKIFKEINKVMLYKNKCPESIFDLTMYLFQKRGFDDIVIVLSGIFKNLRGEINSKKAQKILLQYFKYCDTLSVFSEFAVIMINNDLEISLNAIDFTILLLKSIEKEVLLPILPEFTLILSKLLSNEKPEIRKGAVLCFVSIFSTIGIDNIDQYTSNLTQAQHKLIMIYLERNNQQKQVQ